MTTDADRIRKHITVEGACDFTNERAHDLVWLCDHRSAIDVRWRDAWTCNQTEAMEYIEAVRRIDPVVGRAIAADVLKLSALAARVGWRAAMRALPAPAPPGL